MLKRVPEQQGGGPAQVPRTPVPSVGLVTLYQDKVAKDIGCKHLLEPVSRDPVLLSQQPLSCGEHMNHFSETAEDNCMTRKSLFD